MHQIGVGVLGPVFRTYDPEQDRLFAVKAFHVDFTPEQAHTLVDILERLVDVRLSNGGIVPPVAAGLEDGVPFLAQEYVAAESLDVAMRHYAPASIVTAFPLIERLAEAIDAAHGCGVCHGGLHLRDVFVTPDGARLTGFGVVPALEEIGLHGPIRRPYTAPEMIAGRSWGGEADRFALAAIAYELLTGKRPAGTGSQVTARLDSVDGVADVEALQTVFTCGLADSPDSRYATAARFVSDLRAAVGTQVDDEGDDTGTSILSDGRIAVSTATAARVDRFDLLDGLELHDKPGESIEDDDDPVVDDFDDDSDEDALVLDVNDDEVAGEVIAHAAESEQEESGAGFDLPLYPTYGDEADTDEEPTDDVAFVETGDELVQEITEEDTELVVAAPEPTVSAERPELSDFPDLPAMPAMPAPHSPLGSDQEPRRYDLLDESDDFDPTLPVAIALTAGDKSNRRTWVSGRTAAVMAVLVVGAAAGYFGGLRLGGPESPLNEVASEQGSAVPASRTVSEVVVDDFESDDPSRGRLAAGPAGRLAEQPEPEPQPDPEPIVTPAPAPPELSPPAPARDVPAREVPDPDPVPTPAVRAEAPGLGWLLVRTTPPGARVTLDGVERGYTPLSLEDVPFGSYRIEVSYAGFRSQTQDVRLSAASTVAAVGIDLPPAQGDVPVGLTPGSVAVASRPDGARVILDGQRVGTTPAVLSDVPSGTHQLRIERDGYQAWVTTIDVSPSDQTRVAASLDRLPR